MSQILTNRMNKFAYVYVYFNYTCINYHSFFQKGKRHIIISIPLLKREKLYKCIQLLQDTQIFVLSSYNNEYKMHLNSVTVKSYRCAIMVMVVGLLQIQ